MCDHKKDITVRLIVNYTKVHHSTPDDSSSNEDCDMKRERKVLVLILMYVVFNFSLQQTICYSNLNNKNINIYVLCLY